MLIIAKGRPIEIRCYAIAADGNQMTVQEGDNVLFSLISSGVCVGADYITDEVDKHGEPYVRILIEKWYTLDKLTPGAYSVKLAIGERKMRLTDVFSIDRNRKNDNTNLQEGDKVVIRLTVKETPTGAITWAEDITVPGTLECIRVNGSNYYMDDRCIQLPDYPSRLSDLEEDAGHRLLTDAEKQQLLALISLIPAEASENNPLADKEYVQEEIRRAASLYRGTNTTAVYEDTFLRWANSLQHDINDYVFWQRTDMAGNIYLDRYMFNGENWVYEYRIVSTQFTDEQWAAINSGITSGYLTQIADKLDELEQAISELPSEQELNSKLDNTPTGSHNRPIYIKPKDGDATHGEAEEVDGIDVPGDINSGGNVQAKGGMSANGYADLSMPGGQGGAGSVTAVAVSDAQVLTPDASGVIDMSGVITEGMEEYNPSKTYTRGESFYIVGASGRRTPYRVLNKMSTLNYGSLERLTLKAASEPLNVGSTYIQSLT